MAKRDKGTADVSFELDGAEVDYILAEADGVKQWFPTFVDEVPAEQRTGPTAFSYDDAPRVVSQPVDFSAWTDGAGFVDAPPGTTSYKGYSYSQGVDASEGVLCISPANNEMVGGDAFTGMYHSPTWGYYGWKTTFLYHLEAGEWVETYSAAANITDLKEYGNSTDVYLFLALGDAQACEYTTDAFATSPTAVTGEEFTFFAVRGNSSVQPVLLGITRDGLIRTSVNPILTGNWSNADRIGSAGETVTSLVVANDIVWVFKEEGYYTFDGTNVGTQVPVESLKRTGNGSEAYVWLNGFIYVNYANRLLKINPFDNTTEVLIAPAHPEINGKITAITGDTRWLYVFMLNADANTYCLKVNPETGVTHTFLYFADTEINAALVVTHGDESPNTTNEVLMYGRLFGD